MKVLPAEFRNYLRLFLGKYGHMFLILEPSFRKKSSQGLWPKKYLGCYEFVVIGIPEYIVIYLKYGKEDKYRVQ